MASTTNTNIPDFNVPGHGFRSAVAGTEKLRNIPATTEADRILAEIQRLIDEAEQTRLMIQQTRHENREQFTRLQQSLLTTIQTSDNVDSAARVQNANLSNPSGSISHLLNPSTSTESARYPTTPAELGRMTQDEFNAVLQELNVQDPSGSLASRMRQLSIHIGLEPRPDQGRPQSQ